MFSSRNFKATTIFYVSLVIVFLLCVVGMNLIENYRWQFPRHRRPFARTRSSLYHTGKDARRMSLISLLNTQQERTNQSNAASSLLRGGGKVDILPDRQNVLKMSTADGTNKRDHTLLNVGFLESVRRFWTYPSIFRPPESPRECHCRYGNGESQTAMVTLENVTERIGRFDILIIPRDVGCHPSNGRFWETILSVAPPRQRRVYATFEGANKLKYLSPSSSGFNNKIFHWSWTHHSNSDFPMPYGSFAHIDNAVKNAEKDWTKGNSALVAWMSTWSDTSWRRTDFVEMLQKYLTIDLFGSRYRKCPRNTKECERQIRSYKFYLALENSCCGEYITEKFWRTLSWDIVPIVVGANRSDYERLAPPNSFIYADDYGSAKELADYVMYLSKNDDEYNKYFLWKSQGSVQINYPQIEENPVTTTVPPVNFFYSCKSICRVAERYNNEIYDSQSSGKLQSMSEHSYFDPNNDWWCGSCIKCGQHQWIRDFAK